MKAILEFNLPDDQIEFDFATSAGRMHSVLWDLDQWLRGNIKHSPDNVKEGTYEAFQKCRDQLRELMTDNNLNFD